jgi:hypothetical protein
VGKGFPSPVDAVRWFGAVQAQDYIGAKWALGKRVGRITDVQIDRLFDAGAILRTHVLRPTWHFVHPDDIRWMLELTGPRVRRGLAGRYRQLELDDHVIARAAGVFAAALAGGRHLTRPQLGEVLRAAGIAPDGQRLPHLLSAASLAGVITSGPRRGKQFTFAVLSERAPKAGSLERVEAVAELTRRYFISHGPAQIQDFVWWSGLTAPEARTGIGLAGAALEHQVIDGKEYWFDAAARSMRNSDDVAHLLPNFDEYTVAYRDRAAALHPDRPLDLRLFSFGSILSNVVTVGGRVVGSWRRQPARDGLTVEVRLATRVSRTEKAAIEEAGRRLGRFLERPVEVAWV